MTKEKIPISLISFFSTKGHGGFRNSYKDTINDLANNIDLSLFPLKIASIKHPPEDKEFGLEMKDWFSVRGFKVYLVEGIWKDNDISKHQEYLKDIIRVLLDDDLNAIPFTYWNEGDVVIRPKIGKLIDYLDRGVKILTDNKDILKVGITDREDEFDRINGVMAKHGLDRQAIRVDGFDDFYLHDDLFNFRMSLCRQRDLFQAARILVHNFEKMSWHCEMCFSDAIKMLSDKRHCFVDFDPSRIVHYHGEAGDFKYSKILA